MSESEPAPDPVPSGAILVAVDGSETSYRAVRWAASYANLEDRSLVIVHALGTISAKEAIGLHVDSGATVAFVYERLRAEGEAVVAAAIQKVAESHPSVDITAVIEDADPRQLLLRLAENASLVVMGSRGRGPFRSLLLGSVAGGVAGRAACPVVVVPPADDREAEASS